MRWGIYFGIAIFFQNGVCGWVVPARNPARKSVSLAGSSGEAPASYTDPETGRVTVDVADLGVKMDDIGKKGWADPENVHPKPGERGLSEQDFVTANGDIDWDAMATALQKEDNIVFE
jgi:hypothetical protein